MIIARVLSPVHALGPGNRVGVWTKGCKKNCLGCMSTDLQEADGETIDEEALAQIVIQLSNINDCRAITISGGDPFEQAEALYIFLQQIRTYFDDILVYTGFTYTEILEKCAGEAGIKCLDLIDVLIDGRYEINNNTKECILRGSSNQQIHFLNSNIKEAYMEYMKKGRIVETFVHGTDTIIIGILNN